MHLPIRLIPDRSDLTGIYWLVAILAVVVYFGAKVINGLIKGPTAHALAGLGGIGRPFFVFLDVWFGLLFLAVLIFLLRLLMQDVLQYIPGSPFYYTEISQEGIAVREGLRRRWFRWGDLSPFAVGLRERRARGGGRLRELWVVAMAGAETEMPADEKQRYRRAIVRVDPKFYATGEPRHVNAAFADWLNAIRGAAMTGGSLDTAVPAAFRDSAIAAPSTSSSGSAPARSNVIERS